MIVVLVIVAILAAGVGGVLGAYGGRWLTRRELDYLDEIVDTVKAASGRANAASARLETLAAYWPEIWERVEMLDEAGRTIADVDRRMTALEQAIAGHFGISLGQR